MNALARDVRQGLGATPKWLSARYFYDAEGSRLFEQIMALPEYYLTRAETRLLQEQGPAIAQRLAIEVPPGEGVDLVELGSGNGEKTLLLCQALQAAGTPWAYHPIDISGAALEELALRFQRALPGADVHPLLGDYDTRWPDVAGPARRRVALLMGSNLGNLTHEEACTLLARVRARLHEGDALLLGLDLQKDPLKILRAYDDTQGITARFNLNLLARLNRELGMDFDLARFRHYASYSPLDGAARSFLVSVGAQRVHSTVLGTSFSFEDGEAVYMEQSQKYTPALVGALVQAAGLTVTAQFVDAVDHYGVFLCQPGG